MSSLAYAFGIYLLGAIVVTYPLILAMDRALSDPVDAMLNTWILAFEHHALLTQPLALLDTNIFYPYKQTLLFSETLILPALWLLPVRVFSGSAIFTHNVLVLLGFTLTATSGYLLGRWLLAAFWPALAVGAVFAFNSFMLSNLGQAQLLHFEWLPLALIYMGKIMHQPRPRFVLLLALFLTAQFYTVIYYGVFSFLVIAIVGCVWLLFAPFSTLQPRLHRATALLGALLLALLLCLPLALAYHAVATTLGFTRGLADTWPYAASWETWTTARPDNLLYGDWLGRELPTLGYYTLDALFPGLILLALVCFGIGCSVWHLLRVPPRGRARSLPLWPLFLVAGIALFTLLSLGPYLQIKVMQPDFARELPYAWVHAWVPGFSGLRAPVRFAAIVFLGLALAAGYALSLIRWRGVTIALLVLVLLEVMSRTTTAYHTPVTTPDQDAAYAWLATLPPTTILELPIYPITEDQATRWLESQFHSLNHWHATPIGYSGFFPPRYEEFVQFLADFPRPEVVSLLQAMGVEWVVVHRDRFSASHWHAIEQAAAAGNWQTQQWQNVWALRLPKLNAQPVRQHFHLPEVAHAGGKATIGVILMSDQATPLVPNDAASQIEVVWWYGDQRVLTAHPIAQSPFFVDHLAVASFVVPVPEEAATYSLRVYGRGSHQELASGLVKVMEDVAPPEETLLPVRGVAALLVCEEDAPAVHLSLQTIGWYDAPFTLSGRLQDAHGQEIARSTADVEFAPLSPRRNLLHVGHYVLPFASLAAAAPHPVAVELVAYQWQQDAERIVARNFVAPDGTRQPALTLPLTLDPTCVGRL